MSAFSKEDPVAIEIDGDVERRLRALDQEIARLKTLVRSKDEVLAQIRRENAQLRAAKPAARAMLSGEEIAFAMRQGIEAA